MVFFPAERDWHVMMKAGRLSDIAITISLGGLIVGQCHGSLKKIE